MGVTGLEDCSQDYVNIHSFILPFTYSFLQPMIARHCFRCLGFTDSCLWGTYVTPPLA